MDYTNLRALARAAMNAQPGAPVAYSYGEEQFSTQELNDVLRAEFAKLAGTYQDYRENKNMIFRLIEETIDDVLPKRLDDYYGAFCDVRQLAQGERAIFRTRISATSKIRAKGFVTRVGLAGRYEVFKLDGATYEVKLSAIGAAARLEFEEFLDGRWNFADFTEIILEGMNEYIYKEIVKALEGLKTALPAANKAAAAGFDADTMDELLTIADAYGQSAIYCTYEFASKMVPADAWASDEMKNRKWNVGYLAGYHGHDVIILPQFISEDNTTKLIDPQLAYIIPVGNEKPIKLVFEGQTAVREVEDNDDWSRDMQTYKKFGVAVFAQNWMCLYKNTALSSNTRTKNPWQ